MKKPTKKTQRQSTHPFGTPKNLKKPRGKAICKTRSLPLPHRPQCDLALGFVARVSYNRARVAARFNARFSASRVGERVGALARARALVRWRSRWRVGAWSARVHQARTCFYIRLFFSAGKLQNAIAGIAASPGLRCCAWFCCARLLKSRRQKKRHAHCL